MYCLFASAIGQTQKSKIVFFYPLGCRIQEARPDIIAFPKKKLSLRGGTTKQSLSYALRLRRELSRTIASG